MIKGHPHKLKFLFSVSIAMGMSLTSLYASDEINARTPSGNVVSVRQEPDAPSSSASASFAAANQEGFRPASPFLRRTIAQAFLGNDSGMTLIDGYKVEIAGPTPTGILMGRLTGQLEIQYYDAQRTLITTQKLLDQPFYGLLRVKMQLNELTCNHPRDYCANEDLYDVYFRSFNLPPRDSEIGKAYAQVRSQEKGCEGTWKLTEGEPLTVTPIGDPKEGCYRGFPCTRLAARIQGTLVYSPFGEYRPRTARFDEEITCAVDPYHKVHDLRIRDASRDYTKSLNWHIIFP